MNYDIARPCQLLPPYLFSYRPFPSTLPSSPPNLLHLLRTSHQHIPRQPLDRPIDRTLGHIPCQPSILASQIAFFPRGIKPRQVPEGREVVSHCSLAVILYVTWKGVTSFGGGCLIVNMAWLGGNQCRG